MKHESINQEKNLNVKFYFILLISVLLSSKLTAQTKYSKHVAEQINRVENGLYDQAKGDNKTYNILSRMEHYNVNGLSVALIDNYQMVWAKGYGYADKREKRTVTTSTIFEPGSISKAINAVGILQLAQRGKVNLYQDINEYLSSWKFPYDTVSKGKKITIAQLLSHTGGVSIYGFPGYEKDSVIPSLTDILEGKYPANTPPVRSQAEPGKEYNYSGGGILILQKLLTDIAHQPYEQFMYNNVLKPLGMRNSFYNQPPTPKQMKNRATGYESDGKEVSGKYFVYPEKAAAGLWTTPTDIAKYIINVQLAFKGQSSKVLNQEMIKLHVTPYGNESATMGAFVQDRGGEKYFFHDAGNKGFRGFYIAGLTNGKGVVLFVNSENGNILLELLNSIALEYGWEGFAKPKAK